jgi:antitoxin (DNA-binding transcriptional repressor) of toxin-antitoxin stability system
MTVTEARAALPGLLDRVATGEEIQITRHGRPVAVVVRPDTLRARRADAVFNAAGELHDRLAEARRTHRRPREGISAERAAELIADIRAGRDRR